MGLPGSDHWLMGVEYQLNIYSPLSWKRATDLIITHWLYMVVINCSGLTVWQPTMFMMAKRLKKEGHKSILICHNLFDHDAHQFQKFLSSRMFVLLTVTLYTQPSTKRS